MKIEKELSRKEFRNKFGNESACFSYLSSQKWSEGYQCRSCGKEKYCKGKQLFGRRCTCCGYDESTTAHTLFHKLKFGIVNAFEMMYDITTSKKGANSIWLAERYGVKQHTAWLFRQKVQIAMESSCNFPLEGAVHVDEFEIGTPQKGEQGRSKSVKKVRIVLAVEYRNGKCGRGYAKIINDYSAASLQTIFTEHIEKEADVLTDGWSGYKPLKEAYNGLEQILSAKGQNFKMLHYQIRNFKNWLRGVHSYCNREYLEKYINEYFYRFNRRSHRRSILTNLVKRMVNAISHTYRQIRDIAEDKSNISFC
jgi:hypothetical protein